MPPSTCPIPTGWSLGERRRPRVFIGLTEVAGFYGNLAAGFRAAGLHLLRGSGHASIRVSPAISRGSCGSHAPRIGDAVPRPAGAGSHPAGRLAYAATRLLLLVWAVVRHDAFVFGSRTSFLQLQDLRLLRWLGKRVVFVFTGSDARPPYIDGADMDQPGSHRRECIALAHAKKLQIATIERWSTAIVSHPLYHLFARPTAGFEVLGLAQPPSPRSQSLPPATGATDPDPSFTIESSRRGSELVRATVDRLVAEGLQLELVEIRNVPNWQVHEELQACHFVIDQLYSDVPMSAFAAEAARYEASSRRQLRLGEIARPVPDAHRAGGDVPSRQLAAAVRLAADPAHRSGSARRSTLRGGLGGRGSRAPLPASPSGRAPCALDGRSERGPLSPRGGPAGRRVREIVAAVIRKVASRRCRSATSLSWSQRSVARRDPAVSHSPDGDRSPRGEHAATNSTSPSVRPACIGNARMTEMRGMSWRSRTHPEVREK